MSKVIWLWLGWMFLTSLFSYYHLHWKITVSLFLAGLLTSIKALVEDQLNLTD
ncbi:hypothetical protein P4U44_20115 [Alkalihalobacillus alcalophilus]|uniref:hypothetical protein n=1 Tax=Alkalihalobacillus alcalophilus TaxID=1445 RepID=UPI0002D34AE7|nr:hypothetical protein [Alkalihalobacillus alcalophilus]MED1564178.1 hypothetical protein [Alkalihalobacillus alcalophilus]